MDQFTLLLVVLVIFLIWIFNSLNVLREYERGVIFRIGRLISEPKGPGLIWVFWPIDRIVRVSLRTITLDVPTQDVITQDNVTVKVNAVVYFRVVDPARAIVEVENYLYATSQLAQTTLRSVLGEVGLDDLLSRREKLNQRLRSALGFTDAQVAKELVLSPRTVHAHLSSVYSKLGIPSRSVATRYALEHDLA